MKAHNHSLQRREFLKKSTQAAVTLTVSAGVCSRLLAPAAEMVSSHGSRISYFRNGEIRVNKVGGPEGKPLTTGHMDFKPSWSRTGDQLVFFRRYKDDPVTINWLSAICIMNVDGTGFHQLTDATVANFNPTWTRDGLNTPIWNRRNSKTEGFFVLQGKIGGKPGEEIPITPEHYHTWAYSTLMDGRILVSSTHPTQGWGYFLLTRREEPNPLYQRIECSLVSKGLLDRVSISPSEKKVCFEFQTGFTYKDPGRTLFIADFDAGKRTIANLKPIANQDGKPFWYAYPRWIDGEAAVIYHMMNQTGKGQLYRYQLDDGSTQCVSADAGADYRYPHGEAAPC